MPLTWECNSSEIFLTFIQKPVPCLKGKDRWRLKPPKLCLNFSPCQSFRQLARLVLWLPVAFFWACIEISSLNGKVQSEWPTPADLILPQTSPPPGIRQSRASERAGQLLSAPQCLRTEQAQKRRSAQSGLVCDGWTTGWMGPHCSDLHFRTSTWRCLSSNLTILLTLSLSFYSGLCFVSFSSGEHARIKENFWVFDKKGVCVRRRDRQRIMSPLGQWECLLSAERWWSIFFPPYFVF